MQIHHATFAVPTPERVAHVMAELTRGVPVPMPHPHGAWMVVDPTSPHTLLEFWPAGARCDVGKAHVVDDGSPLPDRWPHHAYVSVELDRDAIVAIVEREGWAHDIAFNGAPGGPGFELVRVWIENQTCIELASPDQTRQYVDFCAALAARARGSARPPA